MSFANGVNDPSTQLFIIEDLTPGYNHINDGSFQNDSCGINNFSCRSADNPSCQQSLHIVSTPRFPDSNQNSTTPTQRRQSARIEAKQKNKMCCESEEEDISEYCLRTKIPGGLTKQNKKLSPHMKVKNSARRKRTKSRHSKQSQDLSNCSSDSEENDPERLWCICRQPHDERFMICCDLCDEWYHGDCVGIKPEEGKCMEKNEIEFVCDSCKLMGAYTGKDNEVDHLQAFTGSDNVNEFMSTQFAPIINTSVSPTNLLTATIVNSLRLRLTEEAEKERDRIATILPETDIAIKCPSEDDSSVSESFSTLTSVEETPSYVVTNENKLSSVNNSCDALNHSSVNNTNSLQSVNFMKVLSRRKKRPRIILKNEIKEQVNSTNSCLGPNCDKTINPQVSVYCSNRCLKAYGMDVLQTVCRKYDSTDPLDKSGHQYHIDGRKTLVVLDRRSGTVLNGTRAPTSDSLIDFLSAHPTFQVVYSRQKSDRSQKTTSFNQSNKCSGQNEGPSNVNKISPEFDASRSPSSVSSESNDKNNKQQPLTSEKVERIRKKYRCLLFALLEKRTQTSRHIFTANRSRLKTVTAELEGVISTRNNLTNYSIPLDGSSPLAQDYSTYKCQLHLFLNCLDNPCISEKSSNTLNSTNSNTESSIVLRDQFFDSLISGTLKPIDLAHCQDVKTLESIVRRTRLADNAHNKLSVITSSVSSNNVNTNHSNVVYGSIPTSSMGISSSDSFPSSDLHMATTITTCQLTETTNTTTVATIANELPILDTTSEHGKHLYDMHCKRCTSQTKTLMKQSSQQPQQQLPKKSISSPSNNTTNVCDGLSTLSVKTEPGVSGTFSGEKGSPFPPSSVESLQTNVSVITSDDLPIQEAVKLSPNDYSTLKRTNYLEDTTNVMKCMDPRRKETNPLHSSFDQYTPKIQSNFKRLNDQSLFEPSTQDSSISTKSLNSFSHSPNYHPPSSGVSTGLLDLPLPPAQLISLHNKSSFDSQTNHENSSYLLSNREKFNSKHCLLWSGMLTLSTQYSGREHMFSLEINVYPFGCIQPKLLNYPSNNDRNEMIQWESLLIGKQTSLVVSRGVNLISLPVYLGQTLLDSTHPRELFALRVTPRTKQMSHIYKDIFNHLKEINACGSLEPRFQGINDCLLYPLIGNTHLKDILLPVNLLSKFQLTGCDTTVENQLLIILTRPINVTSNVENISHPVPSLLSSSSSPPILNPDQETPSNTEEIAVNLPSDDKLSSSLFNSLSKDPYVPTPVQFNEEVLSTENIKMENQTVETSSIDSVGDIDLRPFIASNTINNINQSLYPTQQWCSTSNEDVDYRKLIPQPHIHPGCSTSQNVYNKSSPPINNDYNSSHNSNRSVPRFREKSTSLSSSKRIHTIRPTNYQPVDSARHLLPDPVSKRNSCVTRSPLPSTNPLPVTINIQRSNPCALLPTPSILPVRRPSSSLSLSTRRSSRRPSPRLSRSPRPVSSHRKLSVIVHSYDHNNKHRHSRFRH